MFHKCVAILLLLLSASAALADHSEEQDQQSCPSVEVFIGSQRKGTTEKQLRELETRLNKTVADAITTSEDTFYRSAYGRLLDELNSTVQNHLFHRLKSAVYSELEARFNDTVDHAINVSQDSFYRSSYLQLYNELRSRLSDELNTTVQNELFLRLKNVLYDELFHELFEAILNASKSNDTELSSPPDSVCCGEREGWRRIAYLNMTNPSHSCPPAWREITTPKRTCARGTDTHGCDSAVFPANGYRYSRVCGRIRAYHCGTPDAFNSGSSLINDRYIDGVSITHSDPRQHIWTFAAGVAESHPGGGACPCSSGYSGDHVPSFVGDDYFCDTGADTISPVCNLNTGVGFFPDDPLWDGEGCGNPSYPSTCCEFNNPPWFCKTLPQPTTGDLEVRLCSAGITGGQEDTPIELIEIYVN